MGTWKIPLLHWSLATGAAIWAFDEGGGIVLGGPATGALSGQFPASAVGIYLDGAGVPSDLAALPSGFTPDDAYTFHWRTWCAAAADAIEITFTAIASVLNEVGPDAVVLELDSPLTGCTLLVLQAIASSTVTATMTAGPGGLTILIGNEIDPGPNPNTIIWFNGTYTIAATALPKLPPMPIRTPIMQGGGQRGR